MLLSSPKKINGRCGSYGTSLIISLRQNENPETQKKAGSGVGLGRAKSFPANLSIPSSPILDAVVKVGRGSLKKVSALITCVQWQTDRVSLLGNS